MSIRHKVKHLIYIIMVFTREKFKELWEANSAGSGITFNDIAECAVAWGISRNPRTSPLDEITYKVLKAAQVNDAEDYNPNPDAKFDLFLTKEQREMMQKYIDKINAHEGEIRELKMKITQLAEQKGGKE